MHALRAPGARLAHAARWPLDTYRRGVLRSLTTLELVLGGFGLVAALFTAALLSPALSQLPGAAGDFAPVGMAILIAPLGVAVALGRRPALERFLQSLRERTESVTSAVVAATPADRSAARLVVLDTSAILDGRLGEVARTGFLPGDLLIPHFVLDELRRVADSSDPLRRQRGRQALELLARLQADPAVPTRVDDTDFPDAPDVDAKLLALARVRRAALLTNDYNLNRVAGVEGIRILNLNALAQAVRTVVLPGESLTVRIQQEGRERRQGVGFLDDGTMVVVEDTRERLGQDVPVTVARVIQTQAGRMIFAEPVAPAPTPATAAEAPSAS